ncbi:MAG: hypothetical protein KDB18_10475 [Salinibacterium sp.]|nr:hypothetical protein [Salinibacterium sp.]
MFAARTSMFVATIVGAGMLAGCQSTAPNRSVGESGGRINPYSTTAADRASGQASAPALWEFSDQVAESLAQRIAGIPEIAQSPDRVVVELGNLSNGTDTPTQDFELIQRRLRSKLLTSDVVANRVRFVESIDDMDAEYRRVQATNNNGMNPLTDRYDPRSIYVLRGDFLESSRRGGETRRYFFEFRLTNLQTRTIVFNDSFDLAQVR